MRLIVARILFSGSKRRLHFFLKTAVNTEQASLHLVDEGAAAEPRSTNSAPAMNHSTIPPINKLPSELLADIMQAVVSSALSRWSVDHRCPEGPALRYPEALSHVCSHWRQVAIHSRSLWSQIDIETWKTPGSRAIAFLDRAGQSPLRLHIAGRGYRHSSAAVALLLTPIISRAKSLDLFIHSNDLSEAHPSIIYTCLSSCAIGNLTELAIRFMNYHQLSVPFFIMAHDRPEDSQRGNRAYIDIPQTHLENLLRGITVLRLNLIYPPWTSRAYHGLVELRLLGGAMCDTTIAESQLISILRHSPRLRILHFDLIIVDFVSLDTVIDGPVILQDLEVLNLDWMQEDEIEIFLRWLTPSPALSQFSYSPFGDTSFEHPATVAFLAGSNITMIHINACAIYLFPKEIADLVSLCHHTQVMALDNIVLEDTEETSLPQLHTLYLLASTIEVNHLRQWIQSSSIQQLILYEPNLNRGGSKLDLKQGLVLLSDMCPEVVVLPSGSLNPIEGWEMFWDIND